MRKSTSAAVVLISLASVLHAEDLTHCTEGWAETEAGDHLAAIDHFNLCITTGDLTKATLARTYRNMGIAYRRAKEPRRAIEAHTLAIELQPDDIYADYVGRANSYDEAGDIDRALADYERALELNPNFGETYYNRGIARQHHGQTEEAKKDFLRAYEVGLRTKMLLDTLAWYGLTPAS
jgi:tetratricopeptide (TPR) repeat protein